MVHMHATGGRGRTLSPSQPYLHETEKVQLPADEILDIPHGRPHLQGGVRVLHEPPPDELLLSGALVQHHEVGRLGLGGAEHVAQGLQNEQGGAARGGVAEGVHAGAHVLLLVVLGLLRGG